MIGRKCLWLEVGIQNRNPKHLTVSLSYISYQQHYPTCPAMLLSCATIPTGSRLPLPALAKSPLPFPMSSAQLCPHLPVSSTTSSTALQRDRQLPLPSLPSLQLPPSLSRHLLPPPDTECLREGPAVPHLPQLAHITCSSESLHRVGQGYCCPLVHYAQWSYPRLPSPAAFVPGASCLRAPILGSVPSSSSSHPWPQAESWHQLPVLGW